MASLVMHETAGVCRIEGETRLEGLPGSYYVLCPLYLSDATFYTPKDSQRVKIRPVMTAQQACELIDQLPHVAPAVFENLNDQKLRSTAILKSGDSYQLASLTKALYQERQRIGIARAIIMNPDLIIADEPVSALDASIQAQVINLLNELRDELGLSILFIAHDLSVVKYFSDRIIVMYFGKIVEIADSDELFAHPLHPYTCSLLSAIPLPDPHYEKQRKHMVYVPGEVHDYTQEQPTLREVSPGHFVSCNTPEFERYRREREEQ